MTQAEFAVLAKSMKAVYQNMFPDEGAMQVWYSLLKDLPYKAAADALQYHMQTSEFPPTIASIRMAAMPRTAVTELSEQEAWAMARKAIRVYEDQAQEQYGKLPPIVQKAIGNVRNLMEWGSLPSDEVGTVIQSQFLRSFRIVKDREKNDAVISPALRERLAAQIGTQNIALLEEGA